MRRLIATINDTITTLFGSLASGNVVVRLATHVLRASDHARSTAVRLTGRMPACLLVGHMGPVQAGGAEAGAAGDLGRDYRPGKPWARRGRRPRKRGAQRAES